MQAWRAWRALRDQGSDVTGGASGAGLPLFVGVSKAGRLGTEALSDKAVWRLVRQAARDAGIEGWQRYSAHALRAGLATAAGEAGADLAQVMRQTRHRSAKVALNYLRPADLWNNNVTEKLFGGDKQKE